MSIVRHIAYERPVVGLPYDILFAVLLLQDEGRCESVIAPLNELNRAFAVNILFIRN